jgi:hypothetical protein
MAYTTIDDPSAYFQTALYTGDGNAQTITNDGNSDLQPDWVWIAMRSHADNRVLFDSIRGVTKRIISNTSAAEVTVSDMVTSFNSDGFSVGTNTNVVGDGKTFVGWQWKAGTAFSNDASSTSIGSIDSAGSVNQDAGFSICTFTGTGSAATMKHGLNAVPKMIIVKGRSEAKAWTVYHSALGAGKAIFLEQDSGATTSDAYFSGTEPTSSVFGSGSSTNNSGNGITFVAYCFADVQGYSKFGTYTGNGNVDGTFVYTGFKPGLIMYKFTGTESWNLIDTKRNPSNITTSQLIYADSTAAEASALRLDILSNGFKMRSTAGSVNGSGREYIYMAFAENPLVTSTGVPATAR